MVNKHLPQQSIMDPPIIIIYSRNRQIRLVTHTHTHTRSHSLTQLKTVLERTLKERRKKRRNVF